MTDLRALDLDVDAARMVDEMERDLEGTMSGHTPGPWTVVEDPEDRGRYVVAGPDMVGIVMTPAGRHRNEPLRSFLADARLIAAAPEMGELLLSAWQHVSHGGPTRAEVEAVLRKAGLIE